MSNENEEKKMAAEPKPQQPAPAPPAKKSELPDKIPEFPGDGSSGDPG